MKLLIFGGTTEGRILAKTLTERGNQVTVSVATPLGAEELRGIPCEIWEGRLDETAMAERIRGFPLVIDATHPYASRYPGTSGLPAARRAFPAPGTAGRVPGGGLHPGGQL